MWIEELDVRGFGRLRGLYRFVPGLNLVVGENETGKSTLHEALIRALCGFTREEQRKPREGVSVRDRWAPWEGEAFGLNAVVRQAGSRSLRVEWDFRAGTVRLLDGDTGADLSEGVPVRRGEVLLGRHLLGLDLQEFRDACCLDQAAVAAVRRTEDLAVALQQAVETHSLEGGVEEAVRILNEFLKTTLGVHSGHFGDLAAGPLAALRRERDELERRIEACECARGEVAEMAAELTEREFQLEVLRKGARALEQAVRVTEVAELEDRETRARLLEARARDVPAAAVVLAPGVVGEVRGLLSEIAHAEVHLAELADEVARGGEELREAEARRDRLTARVDALEAYAGTDPRAAARIRELRGERHGLVSGRVPEPVSLPAPHPALEAYRERRGELTRLAAAQAARGWDGRWLVLAVVAGLAAAGAAGLAALPAPIWFVSPPRLAWGALTALLALVCALCARRARPERARRPLRRRLEEALAELGACSLEELDARAAEYEARLAAARELAVAREREERERRERWASLELEARRLLDPAGATPIEPLDTRIDAYLVACDRQAERLALIAELEHAGADILRLRQPAAELTRRRAELDERRRKLAELYREVGVATADPVAARTAFEELVRRAEADHGRLAAGEEATAALRALLGGETIGSLAARVEEARRLLEDHVSRHGRLAGAPGDRTALEADRERVQKELAQLERGATEIRTRIGEREGEMGSPAELKERLDEVTAQLAAMERAREAVKVAREELKLAALEAHRRFAPRLNAALERHLPTLTGERYRVAAVDDDLRIRVQAPETGRMIPAESLSRGTQDQIYLLERLEIARLLDPEGSRLPILLDDPFARFDERRLRRALEVMRETALERQVVLFTEDRALVPEARATCRECRVLELPAPHARPQEAALGEGAPQPLAAADAGRAAGGSPEA